MREIALRSNNVTKARQVRLAKYNNAGKKVRTIENIEKPKEAQLPKKREITLSIYDWQVTLSENEIRIRK